MIKVDKGIVEIDGDIIDVISEVGYLCGAFIGKIEQDTSTKRLKNLVLYSIIQGTILGSMSREQQDKVTRTASEDLDKITYEIRNAFNVAIKWGNEI
jgi:hypothetical protein